MAGSAMPPTAPFRIVATLVLRTRSAILASAASGFSLDFCILSFLSFVNYTKMRENNELTTMCGCRGIIPLLAAIFWGSAPDLWAASIWASPRLGCQSPVWQWRLSRQRIVDFFVGRSSRAAFKKRPPAFMAIESCHPRLSRQKKAALSGAKRLTTSGFRLFNKHSVFTDADAIGL